MPAENFTCRYTCKVWCVVSFHHSNPNEWMKKKLYQVTCYSDGIQESDMSAHCFRFLDNVNGKRHYKRTKKRNDTAISCNHLTTAHYRRKMLRFFMNIAGYPRQYESVYELIVVTLFLLYSLLLNNIFMVSLLRKSKKFFRAKCPIGKSIFSCRRRNLNWGEMVIFTLLNWFVRVCMYECVCSLYNLFSWGETIRFF